MHQLQTQLRRKENERDEAVMYKEYALKLLNNKDAEKWLSEKIELEEKIE